MDLKRNKTFRKIYRVLFPSLECYLRSELRDSAMVVDLGCGAASPLRRCSVPYSVGVEVFEPYLEESHRSRIHNQYIRADIRKINFKPKSFDAVVLLDVLEHLTKEEGHDLLRKGESWARKKVIVYTPNGYEWQDAVGNNEFEIHKSGWTCAELENRGFNIHGCNGLKFLRGYKSRLKFKPMLFWMVISDLTQKVTFYLPSYAFQLFGVKVIK